MINGPENKQLKALTLWQPWATLVAIGAKRIETRSWSTDHRGLLAIHAANSKKGYAEYWKEPFLNTLQAFHYWGPEYLPRGRIIAVCELVDILPTQEIRGIVENRELAFGDYTNGRFAWLLENVRRLPIEMPVKGHQRLWTWDYSTETEAIQTMIERGIAFERGNG